MLCVCVSECCGCVSVLCARLQETQRLPARMPLVVGLGPGLGPGPRPEVPEACQGSPRQRAPPPPPALAGPLVSWKPNAEGLAGRAEATQVCSGSRGPGHPLTPPAPGGAGAAGVAGGRGGCGSKNWDAGRGLKDLFW